MLYRKYCLYRCGRNTKHISLLYATLAGSHCSCYHTGTMGVTSVPLTLKNPSDPDKAVTGEFLVDSGAHFTVVPAAMVKALRKLMLA